MASGTNATAKDAVLVQSEEMPADSSAVEELDFDKLAARGPILAEDILWGSENMGFQAAAAAQAAHIINNMRAWENPETGDRTTIFLGYTSNLISSGLRGAIRYLVKHGHVSAVVTTAGGVEEDFIKCLGKTYMGSFTSPGAELRAKGLNRIGNLIVPNDNYCKFETWISVLCPSLRC